MKVRDAFHGLKPSHQNLVVRGTCIQRVSKPLSLALLRVPTVYPPCIHRVSNVYPTCMQRVSKPLPLALSCVSNVYLKHSLLPTCVYPTLCHSFPPLFLSHTVAGSQGHSHSKSPQTRCECCIFFLFFFLRGLKGTAIPSPPRQGVNVVLNVCMSVCIYV
jgi:hypothetical protein